MKCAAFYGNFVKYPPYNCSRNSVNEIVTLKIIINNHHLQLQVLTAGLSNLLGGGKIAGFCVSPTALSGLLKILRLLIILMPSPANGQPEAYSTEVVRAWLYVVMCVCACVCLSHCLSVCLLVGFCTFISPECMDVFCTRNSSKVLITRTTYDTDNIVNVMCSKVKVRQTGAVTAIEILWTR